MLQVLLLFVIIMLTVGQLFDFKSSNVQTAQKGGSAIYNMLKGVKGKCKSKK